MKSIKVIWKYFIIIYNKLVYMAGGILEEELYWKTAKCWMDIDNYRRATRNYEKYLKIYDVSYVRYYLAWCYQNLGEIEKALINYEKAYEKKKENIYVLYIAHCKYILGDKTAAVALMKNLKNENMEDKLLKEYERIEKIILKTSN